MPQSPFYSSAKWRKTRATHLALHPYCVVCERIGFKTKAIDVDHKLAMAKGGAPFDKHNLQSLCKKHHGQKTIYGPEGQHAKFGKVLVTTGEDGYPIHIENVRNINRGPQKF